MKPVVAGATLPRGPTNSPWFSPRLPSTIGTDASPGAGLRGPENPPLNQEQGGVGVDTAVSRELRDPGSRPLPGAVMGKSPHLP